MSHCAVWVGFRSFLSFKPADKYLTPSFYDFKLLPLQACLIRLYELINMPLSI